MNRMFDEMARVLARPVDRREMLKLVSGAIGAAIFASFGAQRVLAAACTTNGQTGCDCTNTNPTNTQTCNANRACCGLGTANAVCCATNTCCCARTNTCASSGGAALCAPGSC
jgi:hypothetical protein